ncbi:MAG: hypothetical protein UZ15_CFX003000503 [Chloroflexi bacterium OLB15]|nr:MAG: hypothetical protein UZ15_CFX003000503 [Chloroflexi bacterium OLB15]
MLKNFYLVCAIIGTIIPWLFFAHFFRTEGVNLSLFLSSLFANGAAGGFSADVLISILVFWVWSFTDANRHHISRWWLVLPASFLVGLSLALPLYLYLREVGISRAATEQPERAA